MQVDYHRLQLSWQRKVGLNILIVIVYVLAGNIGFLFSTVHSNYSLLWPPSGVALALALIFGPFRVILGIAFGILLLGLQSTTTPVALLGLIASNLIETIMASMLLYSVGKGQFKFKSPGDILSFIIIAVLLSPFVSSTLGITYLYLSDMIGTGSIPEIWFTIFFGNSLGILVFTPLILCLFNKNEKHFNILEASILFGGLGAFTYWSFVGPGIWSFLIIPFFTWAALRFSFGGVGLATLLVASVAVFRITFSWKVFGDSSVEVNSLWLQCLTSGTAIAGYFMATVGEAHEAALEKELELILNLKHKRIAEEALAILDQTIHQSPICFGLLDKDYKYIRINQALANLHNIDANMYLGKTLNEISPLSAQLIEPLVDNVFATGASFMNTPIEGLAVGLLSCYPIRHPMSDEIFAVAVSFQNMSEEVKIQKLLRENQARLAFAQDAGKIGAFEWNEKSNRIFWNTELENIYGAKHGEFDGYYGSWIKWIHPQDRKTTVHAVKKVLSGEKELNHQFRITTKTNETRWILARGKMVKDQRGRNVKFIGINIDLTEQKSIEQKLRLTEANLLHALSVRDEFMATASHELKTPLTSLKLQIQVFQRGVMKNDVHHYTPQRIQQLLEKSSHQIDRLTRLVDDMLDISRMETGKLSIRKEPCSLNSLLKDVLIKMGDQFVLSGSGEPIILHLDESIGEWDPLRIEQMMINIITNAIRYGKGKPISVGIRNDKESVRFSVKDQGIGIARSDQQKIFNRYERGLLAREVSGLGLGLFITKQIVEAHGGKIWVESEINQGSCFFVDLPVGSE